MQLQLTTSLFGDPRLPARFWTKVRVLDNGCWFWQAWIGASGYGQFEWQGRQQPAHRVAYETLVVLIPPGLEPDHLCRVRACVNPMHIEPVTPSVNILRGDHWERRKTHCPQGHAYSGSNLILNHGVRSGRQCRTCHQLHNRKSLALRKNGSKR